MLKLLEKPGIVERADVPALTRVLESHARVDSAVTERIRKLIQTASGGRQIALRILLLRVAWSAAAAACGWLAFVPLALLIPNLTLLRQAAVVVAVVWAIAVAPSAVFAADRIERMSTVTRTTVGACLGLLIFLILIAGFSFTRLSILDMLALTFLQWPLMLTSALFGAITLVLLGVFLTDTDTTTVRRRNS